MTTPEEKLREKRKAEEGTQKEIAEIYGTNEMKTITKKLGKLIVKPVTNPKESLSDSKLPKLLTGTILDDILGKGGTSAGKLIELYGEYGTGKTQIVFTFAVEASQKGTVVFDDNEYTFCSDRLEEICKARGLDVDKMWKNIVVYQPEDWMHQLGTIQQIPSPVDLAKQGKEPLQLIIVDSLLALIDVSEDFEGRQNLPIRSRIIRTQMLGKLRQLARTHNCVVIFTNQIQDVPDTKPFMPFYMKQRAKGGPTVSHVPDIMLFLRKAAGDTRLARLMDSSNLQTAERVYCINAKGIDDVPAPVKAKIEEASKKEEVKEVEQLDAVEEAKVEEKEFDSETEA